MKDGRTKTARQIGVKMKVLSLFDGMSCGQIALQRLGIEVEKYVASEIDTYAISVAKKNFPSMIHLGDVRDVKVTEHFDLIMFGSPCQGFSFAGNNLNFEDPRSQLFFEAVRILEEAKLINPNVKFLMENVRMKKESEQVITDLSRC
jgi:site-specific DNA-cytosine methylase